MAFIFAKEQFSRRSTCTGIKIIKTRNIFVSELSEAEISIYEKIGPASTTNQSKQKFVVFQLMKRGKQHKLAGEVLAASPEEALYQSKLDLDPGKPVYNVWVAESDKVLTVSDENRVIWDTLPEKSFRDAIAYRGADKIKKFKEEQESKK
jgi:ring-1,2-phenylacetyl-CoA epoxidase subunit PaaB